MNNVKKNRTGLKLLGSGNNNFRRFTMNKTQQNQPVYSNVQPRCPGIKGQRGGKDCSGSNTNVGCKSCLGCLYTFDVSSNAFGGSYPSYGSFININLVVDSSSNPPCEWQYNGIVEGFSLNGSLPYNARVQISIEDNKCVSVQDICGVYFYAPVGGNNGTYVGNFNHCTVPPGPVVNTIYDIINLKQSNFVTTAKRMGAPYRNPIAGWRNSLDCNYKDCSGGVSSNGGGGPGTSHWASKQPTNTVYKDNYSGPKSNCSSDASGCGCCPKDCSNAIVHRPGIQGRTHRPIIRSGMQPKSSCCKPNGTQCFNNYSYSYRQYQHNKRCLDYQRSQEKYVGSYPACAPGRDGKQHCQNAYRKASCCDCDCSNNVTTTPPFKRGGCSNKSETKTIYKPSNKKFSHQGAVTSGGRLERLKLDTIKSANSKCIKGQQCRVIPTKFSDITKFYKYPNGKYGAGKPRFTGWLFNGHHSEVKGRVYNMVRYNQQPLGIPQLTAHPPGKTCIKQCFPRTLDLGSNRSTAAGNRARIPGSKCSVNYCVVELYGNSTSISELADFVPGLIVLQPSTGWTGTILKARGDPAITPPTWGWLTVQWNGQGICQKPDLTLNPSGTPTDQLEIIDTPHYFKIQKITAWSATKDCGCAPCNNIPDQTGQGLRCC